MAARIRPLGALEHLHRALEVERRILPSIAGARPCGGALAGGDGALRVAHLHRLDEVVRDLGEPWAFRLARGAIQRLAGSVLSQVAADQAEVLITSGTSALTRFANNYIHQNVEQQDIDVRVRSIIGKKIGVASSNDTSDDGLRAVVERAHLLARHQKENPDFRSLP